MDAGTELRRVHPFLVAAAGLAWLLGKGASAFWAFLGPALVGWLYLHMLAWRVRRRRAAGPLVGMGFLLLMGGVTYAMIKCFPGEESAAVMGLLLHAATLMGVAIRQGIRARIRS